MCVIYFVWYFSIFLLYFSKILATNIDSITSYSKIREEIKSMYVCMYVSFILECSNSRTPLAKCIEQQRQNTTKASSSIAMALRCPDFFLSKFPDFGLF